MCAVWFSRGGGGGDGVLRGWGFTLNVCCSQEFAWRKESNVILMREIIMRMCCAG